MAKWTVKWTDEHWYMTYIDADSRDEAYDILLSGEFDDAKCYHVEKMDTDISIELTEGQCCVMFGTTCGSVIHVLTIGQHREG